MLVTHGQQVKASLGAYPCPLDQPLRPRCVIVNNVDGCERNPEAMSPTLGRSLRLWCVNRLGGEGVLFGVGGGLVGWVRRRLCLWLVGSPRLLRWAWPWHVWQRSSRLGRSVPPPFIHSCW